MSLPNVDARHISRIDSRRNRVAVKLANLALRLASDEYRRFVKGSIRYGLAAAVKDAEEAHNRPLSDEQPAEVAGEVQP